MRAHAQRRGGLVAAAMAAALALTACGVSLEEEPEVEAAGDPRPSGAGTADGSAATGAPDDREAVTAEPDSTGATSEPAEGAGEAVPILYAGPAAGSPEVEALGSLIQFPVESCLALYRDAVPDGAFLEPEPRVRNTENDLSLRCTLQGQSASVLFTGEVRIMPDQREDQQVVVDPGGEEALQRGHLRSEIYVINDAYPENHLSTITGALDRVGNVTVEPFVEELPPAELASDLPTSYTQPGRNTEEIIRLYRLIKDPYAGCQHLLAGALPEGARIQDDPMTHASASQLTLWCTVEAPGGLAFVSARSVVHPQTDTAVTEPLSADDRGWQEGFVLMTVDLSGAEIDPADLLPAMHANLRADF